MFKKSITELEDIASVLFSEMPFNFCLPNWKDYFPREQNDLTRHNTNPSELSVK